MRFINESKPFEEKINYFKLCQSLYSEIKKRDDMLEQYAFITSHQLRAPIARVMGLINVFNSRKDNEDLCSVLAIRLEQCATELDDISKILNRLTETQNLEIE